MPPVYLLLDALMKEGFRIHWMILDETGLRQKSVDLFDGKLSITFCRPPAESLYNWIKDTKLRHLKLLQFLYLCVCVWKVLRLLRHTRVDLVYGASPPGVLVAAIVAYLRHLPRITRLHGSLLYFRKLQRRPEWLDRWYPAENIVFRWPGDAMILTNDGTYCDRLAKRFGTDPEKVFFLINGVDKTVPADAQAARGALRQRLGLDDATVMFATVSRLTGWKRVDRASRAMAALRTEGLDCRLFVVGDGSSRTSLEELARSTGAAESVTFMGALPHREATVFIRAADVFLSLYDYSNLANPVIEAMVAGQCIVSIADGSLNGIIIDGESGILVPQETLETQLPKRLASLIHDPQMRRRLGAGAAQAAQSTFQTWEQRIAAEMDIIKTLAAGKRLDKSCWTARWAARPSSECAADATSSSR